ncbi:putative transcriptional regulator [Parvibaculum indicum]|uniref:YqgE/AlgH family protein n=1 Tax=Parvibaculum indicum TaxID=562969 RepID=UPI0014227B6B|nr:YqgE/AlgH family protein [Parvibaculum indicum]NIJ41756.1 putative transcriptional regulator [Parvibaculum indicum]
MNPTLHGLSYQPDEDGYMEGKMLIAMPSMEDERFERTLIYMCVHNPEGAMGIVVNKPSPDVTFPELLTQLSIDVPPRSMTQPITCPVLVGGPVEVGRGFVLHTQDYFSDESTLPVDADVGLTASVDILRAMAAGGGPSRALLALGYAGWAPGQLDQEIQANGWLHCEADPDLIFGLDLDAKYTSALGKLGVDISLLSGAAGHA